MPGKFENISAMATQEELVYGWVSTNCGRGTSDILWSCLATIFLCVWTVIHLPVPLCSRIETDTLVPGEPESSTRKWVINSGIVTGLASVVLPEFLTGMAVSELFEAWGTQKGMQRSTNKSWTLTHSFFLHMGGFCLESPSGFRLQLEESDIEHAISGDPQASAHSLEWLSKIQKVSKDQIHGHAKSNHLTKLISCVQTLWLIAQVISRACQHQAITLLEISATAYAVCALVAYVAWWKKPQSSDLPIMIPCSDEAFPQNTTWKTRSYFCNWGGEEVIWAGQNYNEQLNAASFQRFGVKVRVNTLYGPLFHAIYFASWNYALLSHVERWLWRASIVYCCFSNIFMLLLKTLWSITPMSLKEFPSLEVVFKRGGVLEKVNTIFSLFSRFFIIFEVFYSLRALPRSAYESVQWSSFLPHI